MYSAEHQAFEDQVRRVARALWPRATTTNSVIIAGRERDGVFHDGDVFHIVEATTSTRKEKVRQDLEKSTELAKELKRLNPESFVKIWIVTQSEPTAEQSSLAGDYRKKGKCPVEIKGYRAFSDKLIDSSRYIALRRNYAFGSIRNPADQHDFNVPENEYIPLELMSKNSREILSANDIESSIIGDLGSNFIIVGDYGSGKSMTLRALYYSFSRKHLNGSLEFFPIYLNLRDHFGQTDTSEALLRHGVKIGLNEPNQLVAAWRAGNTVLILDGFDEVSSVSLVKGTDKIKRARRQAVSLVREFIRQSPRRGRVIIGGREHYFDSYDELTSALGCQENDRVVSLSEFTAGQIEEFLKKKNIVGHIPDWIPSRPLLLGYLVVRGFFSSAAELVDAVSQEEGWSYILDRICSREAEQIDPVLIEPSDVREFIERLATRARNSVSRRGPIHIKEINEAFEDVFDRPPDEKAEALILRLPGLTASAASESAREFIDDDFVDACRAGDPFRFVLDPYDETNSNLESVTTPMGYLGCRLAAWRLKRGGVTEKQISSAFRVLADKDASSAVCGDLMVVMQELGVNYIDKPTILRDGFREAFEVDSSSDLSGITFYEYYFNKVLFDPELGDKICPRFSRCHIEELSGPTSRGDISKIIFVNNTEISSLYQEASTNAEILELSLPLSVKVLLTILRKLFVQYGAGRKENAFYRGLDTNAKEYVKDILELLHSRNFANPYKISGPRVWMPNRAKRAEALEMMNAPQSSSNLILLEVKGL